MVLARNQQGLDAQGGNGQLPGYLGAIPVPGVGALLTAVNAMRRGKDVTVDGGTLFAVYASNDPATARCDRTR
ncbi:MAG: hypothetical protein JOY59_12020 [Candidatus Eremiobacteraeota bacterium]|nr:hypothetical protein [Candidatus Eremiobacteraeota bacterium]